MLRRAAAALTLAFAFGIAGLARAEATETRSGGFLSPVAGARLTAGMSARVVWDRPSGGLAGCSAVREMELVLSLDGGRTFPIRLTRDLAPDTRAVFWRVPAFPTRAARIALRVGEGEEPGDERLELVGEPFEIVDDGAGVLTSEPVHRIRGEWRTEAALSGSARVPSSSDFDSESPESLQASGDDSDAAESPRFAGIDTPATSTSERAPPSTMRIVSPRAPARLSSPAFPLRP